jgi:acid phosphatase type 7
MFGLHVPNGLLFSVFLLLLLAAWLYSGRRSNNDGKNLKNAIAYRDVSFLIKPYQQLGDNPKLKPMESVQLLWHTAENARNWQVQLKVQGDADWRPPVSVSGTVVDIAKLGKHLHFRACLDNIPPGATFEYRLLVDGANAFAGLGKARAGVDQPYKAIIAGDLGKSAEGDMQPVAYRIGALLPDVLIVVGDVVYDRGRVSEYLEDIFAIYNHNWSNPKRGAPILRSTIVLPVPGNHDVALPSPESKRDFQRFEDLLGYYLFWDLPMHGPQRMGAANAPALDGDQASIDRFLTAAGDRFPRTGCYSFDWGNSHWTMLDSNAYMNWGDKDLVAWLENDLGSAQDATWRFVVYHHPSFSSDGKHADEQRMRLLAPILERMKVDVVFTGHNHCYERSRPIRFLPDHLEQGTALHTEDCAVPGSFQLDEQYDGFMHTKPQGVIYLVDGAAGAKFYPHSQPEQLKDFSEVYDQSQHSVTKITVDGKRFTAVQVGADGAEIDRFMIDKN